MNAQVVESTEQATSNRHPLGRSRLLRAAAVGLVTVGIVGAGAGIASADPDDHGWRDHYQSDWQDQSGWQGQQGWQGGQDQWQNNGWQGWQQQQQPQQPSGAGFWFFGQWIPLPW